MRGFVIPKGTKWGYWSSSYDNDLETTRVYAVDRIELLAPGEVWIRGRNNYLMVCPSTLEIIDMGNAEAIKKALSDGEVR